MELNFKVFGTGDPLVIVHGLFGTLDNWQTLARQLSKDYMVFVVDQRNHGRSPHIPGRFDYTMLADDLREFLEHHWVYHAHILGHSMGGKTAMQFALTHPDMVDKLIVADMAPKKYIGNQDKVFEALYAVPLANVVERTEVVEILRHYLPGDETTVQFLMKNLTRLPDDDGFAWKMNLDAIHQSYDNIMEDVANDTIFKGDTLFLRGGLSRYVLDSDWPDILRRFPRAQLATIPDAGHWLHAERPETFLDMVRAFLRPTVG